MLKKYIITPMFKDDADSNIEQHVGGHVMFNGILEFFTLAAAAALYVAGVQFVGGPINLIYIPVAGVGMLIGFSILRQIVNFCVKFVTDNTRQYWIFQTVTFLNPDNIKNLEKKQQSTLTLSILCYLSSIATTLGVIISFNPVVVTTVLATVLIPIAIVVGILYTARAVFRLSVKLNNHITDRSAHNQSEPTSD